MQLHYDNKFKDLTFVSNNNNEKIAKLLLNQSLSGKEISIITGLSHNAPNVILNRLLNLKVVKKCNLISRQTVKSKGRQHIRYTLNEKKGVFICLSLFMDNDICYIYDFKGDIILDFKIELPLLLNSSHMKHVLSCIQEKLLLLNIENNAVLSIAISVPGLVSPQNKVLVSPHVRTNISFEKIFSIFDCPLNVYSASSVMAIGDITSSKEPVDNYCIMSLYIGLYGLSCTTWHDRKLVSSINGYSGEIGTSPVPHYKNMYNCCAFNNIISEYKDQIEGNTLQAMIEASNTNLSLKNRIMDSARILGERLNLFKTFIGIDKIFVFGDAVEMPEEYFSVLEKALNHTKNHSSPGTKIFISKNPYAVRDGLKLLGLDSTIKFAVHTN